MSKNRVAIQCCRELNLKTKHLEQALQVSTVNDELVVGGRPTANDLYDRVCKEYYPGMGGFMFWLTVGRILWAIVQWYINRNNKW